MIEQNTPEWLEMRKNFLGASDAPVVMQISPWKKKYELWEEKLGIRESQSSNEYTRKGHELEPFARKKFCEIFGVEVFPKVVFSEECEYMMASLDGLSLDGSLAVEIKCPGKADHSIAADGKVPDKYYPQLQHQIKVANIKVLYYFSYVSDDDWHLIEVPRDEEYIKNLVSEEEKFWECVKTFTPPESDFVEIDSEEWKAVSSRWKEVTAEIKALEEKEKELREILVKLSDGRASVGNGVKTSLIHRKGNVDYSKIPELKNVDLDLYRKPVFKSWRITINDKHCI